MTERVINAPGGNFIFPSRIDHAAFKRMGDSDGLFAGTRFHQLKQLVQLRLLEPAYVRQVTDSVLRHADSEIRVYETLWRLAAIDDRAPRRGGTPGATEVMMKLIAPFGVAAPRGRNDMCHRSGRNRTLPRHLPESNEPLPDAFITLRVQEAFAADAVLMYMKIAVETFEGIVQLSGTARRQYELFWAKQVALRVSGVRGIRSCIRLAQTD